jgi:glycosyltransferase involved in cell wall biosynthesis
MSVHATDQIIESPSFAEAKPRLSVAIPFFRYDPTPLIEALASEAAALDGAVEIILMEDGGGVAETIAPAAELAAELALPVRLLALGANLGRSRGRNRLFQETRGRHVLFLDCDMAPDRPDFLQTWIALIDAQDPAAAFGGFSMLQARPTSATRLHYALQAGGECPTAAVRARQPEKFVFTSNLLVRRDVFEAEPFDEGFTGWGWEDVEWGVRVAGRYGVVHIDNAATHLGLDDARSLLRKYEQSGVNFARIAARHPAIVARYPSYRMARLLEPLPLGEVGRVLCRKAALAPLPMAVRKFAARLFRAFVYADALRRSGEEVIF